MPHVGSFNPSIPKNIKNTNESVLANINDQYFHVSMFDPPTSKEVHDTIMEIKDSAAGYDEIKCSLVKKVASYGI